MGPLPGGESDLGPTLGDARAAPGERVLRPSSRDPGGVWREGPALEEPARRTDADGGPGAWRVLEGARAEGDRPFRRVSPPAASGRRAFVAGLLGALGIAGGGLLAWRAWKGRDWVAFLTGEPFEVRVTGRRAVAGRAGRLYVVEGTIRNLTGSPKGFFEVRCRLLDSTGQPLAEQVVYAGQVLEDGELTGLARAALERRMSETVFGERMANARVEPRRTVRFQVVFLAAPPAPRIADVEVQVAGVKDVP